jgi:uncharacterized membrane protein YbhN (UPF0104 family)
MLWTQRRAIALLGVMAALLLVIAAIVTACLMVLVHGDGSPLHRWLFRVRPLREMLESFARVPQEAVRDPVSLCGCVGLQLANIALDAATLQVTLVAVGQHAGAGSVFPSLVFASIAEMIPVSWGGLGTFEGVCVAVLHLTGVGLESALLGTLLLRGFTFWLPMVPGVVIVRGEMGKKRRGPPG